MSCWRCGGTTVGERILTEEGGILIVRCLNCGDILDEVVGENRIKSEGTNGAFAFWLGSGVAPSSWIGQNKLAPKRHRAAASIGAGLRNQSSPKTIIPISIGIPKESILKYKTTINGDKYLLIAHETKEAVSKAKDIIQTTGADGLAIHQE